MLTPDQMREFLGRPEMSDDQVTEIRDILYAFADTFIDDYLRRYGPKPPPAGP
jgi:hypothetical protein